MINFILIYAVNNAIKLVLMNNKKKNFESFTCVMWPHFKSNGLNCVPNSKYY